MSWTRDFYHQKLTYSIHINEALDSAQENELKNLTKLFTMPELRPLIKKFIFELAKNPSISHETLKTMYLMIKDIFIPRNEFKLFFHLPDGMLEKCGSFLPHKELGNIMRTCRYFFKHLYNDNSIKCINLMDCINHKTPIFPKKIESLQLRLFNISNPNISAINSLMKNLENINSLSINIKFDPIFDDLYNKLNKNKIEAIEIISHDIKNTRTQSISNCAKFIKNCPNIKTVSLTISDDNELKPIIESLCKRNLTSFTTNKMILAYKIMQSNPSIRQYKGPFPCDIHKLTRIFPKNNKLNSIKFTHPSYSFSNLQSNFKLLTNKQLSLIHPIINNLTKLQYLKITDILTSEEQKQFIQQMFKKHNLKELYLSFNCLEKDFSHNNDEVFACLGTKSIKVLLLNPETSETNPNNNKILQLFSLAMDNLGSTIFNVNTIKLYNIIFLAQITDRLDGFFFNKFAQFLRRILCHTPVKQILWFEKTNSIFNLNHFYKIAYELNKFKNEINLEKFHIYDKLLLECNCTSNNITTFIKSIKYLSDLKIDSKLIRIRLVISCKKDKHSITLKSFFDQLDDMDNLLNHKLIKTMVKEKQHNNSFKHKIDLTLQTCPFC